MYSPSPLDLEITVISAKHLKNVNWRNGDLKPYATFSLDHDPHLGLSTRPDDSGSTRPVWNEVLTIPLSAAGGSPRDATFTVQVFHSKPSETPKPLVGSSRFSLSQLIDSDGDAPRVYALDLYRPSGRPQGKIRVKLAVRERPPPPPPPPRYHDFAPEDRGNYFTPPPFSQFNHSIPWSGYPYGHYYYARPPMPPPPPQTSPMPPPPQTPPMRPFSDHASNYGAPGVPSAPVDFSSYAVDHKLKVPSGYSSPYCPSAPVDFSYPAQEHRPIPPPRWVSDHITAPGESLSSEHLIPTPRWIFNHRASAPVYPTSSSSHSSDNLVPNEPAAPFDSSRYERRPMPRSEDVADALGGLSLEEGNRRKTDYAVRNAPGHDHYQSGC